MPAKKRKRYTKEELEKMFGKGKGDKFENPKLCPDCGSTDIGHDAGEFFCNKCGFVLENI